VRVFVWAFVFGCVRVRVESNRLDSVAWNVVGERAWRRGSDDEEKIFFFFIVSAEARRIVDIPPHRAIQAPFFQPLATLSPRVDRSTSSVDNPAATSTFSTLVRTIGREPVGAVERVRSLHVEVTRSPWVVKRLST